MGASPAAHHGCAERPQRLYAPPAGVRRRSTYDREIARSLITLVAWSRLDLVEAAQTVSAARPLRQDDDMPIRAHHRRRLWAPAIALVDAVAGGVLLAACSDANLPPAAPPGTTQPTQELAWTGGASKHADQSLSGGCGRSPLRDDHPVSQAILASQRRWWRKRALAAQQHDAQVLAGQRRSNS
jgi:hypothetical protein